MNIPTKTQKVFLIDKEQNKLMKAYVPLDYYKRSGLKNNVNMKSIVEAQNILSNNYFRFKD
jgi:hypothetical protein